MQKIITEFPNYAVTDEGQVVNIRTGAILQPCVMYKSFPTMAFRGGTKQEYTRLEWLVANAFVPNPQGWQHVRHLDGNAKNCAADNLEWCEAKPLYDGSTQRVKPVKPPKPKSEFFNYNEMQYGLSKVKVDEKNAE